MDGEPPVAAVPPEGVGPSAYRRPKSCSASLGSTEPSSRTAAADAAAASWGGNGAKSEALGRRPRLLLQSQQPAAEQSHYGAKRCGGTHGGCDA
ncbi:hypothetical protein [Paenibacillus mucilaginosus]|uniref:hypothetical protein n=1 Tax=Paenibacillus mucilaginosus TaxID=61624 RepID=UPI001F3E6852|nr:hypothetical protein [Paenibacillus mucilaginosus]MCG7215558.1 hypothetical protein [Paenibacillus mucilaginosus]WDM26187.1 hypothetical protein KCX80_27675 [Paenibacillus mucilaginosus]